MTKSKEDLTPEDYEGLIEDLKTQIDGLCEDLRSAQVHIEDLEDRDVGDPGLQWLNDNCPEYKISRKDSGIVIEGTIASKQAGFIERYLPKVVRSNKKPPYLIHEGSTFKVYRKVDFKYSAQGESLEDAVSMIISLYCPGDVKVDTQPYEDNRLADYGNQELWVQTTDTPLDDFSKLETVGSELHIPIEGLE